jgi:hypothetical protein
MLLPPMLEYSLQIRVKKGGGSDKERPESLEKLRARTSSGRAGCNGNATGYTTGYVTRIRAYRFLP